MTASGHIQAELAGPPMSGAGPSGSRPRLPEAERRQALISVAEGVFLAQGYAAANMDDVARGARMSKKTLYQLFSSKEALFEAVMADHLAPLLVATPEEAEGDLRDGLIALMERAATHLLAERHVAFFRLISGEVKRAPELAEAFHRAELAHLRRRTAGPVPTQAG